MQNLLLLLSASASSKNVESFFEVSAKEDAFKNAGRELGRLTGDDSSRLSGFFLDDEGANRPRMLNDLGCVYVPHQRGSVCSSKHIAPVRSDNGAPWPPATLTPSTITSGIPHVLDLQPSRRLMSSNPDLQRTTQPDVEQTTQLDTQQPATQQSETQQSKTQQTETQQTEAEDDCSICLQPKEGEQFAPFLCTLRTVHKHSFHEDCITEWCNRSTGPECPMCRSKLIPGSRLDQEAKSRLVQDAFRSMMMMMRSIEVILRHEEE